MYRKTMIIMPAALLCAAVLTPHLAEARAKGSGPFAVTTPTQGPPGWSMSGGNAQSYYGAPTSPGGTASDAYATSPPEYGYAAPAYRAPYAYAVGSPCWYRRQAVYASNGTVVGIRYEYVCQ
jgi:hypothetical protein